MAESLIVIAGIGEDSGNGEGMKSRNRDVEQNLFLF
jgi:hypothetical protein